MITDQKIAPKVRPRPEGIDCLNIYNLTDHQDKYFIFTDSDALFSHATQSAAVVQQRNHAFKIKFLVLDLISDYQVFLFLQPLLVSQAKVMIINDKGNKIIHGNISIFSSFMV